LRQCQGKARSAALSRSSWSRRCHMLQAFN
jgi:hypothetical protein